MSFLGKEVFIYLSPPPPTALKFQKVLDGGCLNHYLILDKVNVKIFRQRSRSPCIWNRGI